MKQISCVFVLLALLCQFSNIEIALAASSELVISEVLAGTADSAKEEFIEIYNLGPQPVDFRTAQWQIQIASSSATSWDNPLRTIKLAGYLMPGNYYLVGSLVQELAYPSDADQTFSSAISAASGHIRIVKQNDTSLIQVDSVEWGKNNNQAIGASGNFLQTESLPAGTSINRDLTSQLLNLYLSASPSPTTTTSTQPNLELPSSDTEDDYQENIFDLPEKTIQITELLPNPASPQTDDKDEYIELYNPNSRIVNLNGYILRVGKTKTKDFKLSSSNIIEANSYLLLYSADIGFSLSNSGSQVLLIDPEGKQLGGLIDYSTAKDGLVWQLVDGLWQWSSHQTPGQPNLNNDTAGTDDQTHDKNSGSSAANLQSDEKEQPVYIHNAVLVGVGLVALLYGAYEYRNDLAVQIRKLRRNRITRFFNWFKLKRRRGHRTNQRSGWWKNRFCSWPGKGRR